MLLSSIFEKKISKLVEFSKKISKLLEVTYYNLCSNYTKSLLIVN